MPDAGAFPRLPPSQSAAFHGLARPPHCFTYRLPAGFRLRVCLRAVGRSPWYNMLKMLDISLIFSHGPPMNEANPADPPALRIADFPRLRLVAWNRDPDGLIEGSPAPAAFPVGMPWR